LGGKKRNERESSNIEKVGVGFKEIGKCNLEGGGSWRYMKGWLRECGESGAWRFLRWTGKILRG